MTTLLNPLGGYAQVEVGVEEPSVPDPESLDATRPVDIDVCPVCDGRGGYEVQTGDPYSGAWDGVECWSCGGTGMRGAA
jgi:hypothetical protein